MGSNATDEASVQGWEDRMKLPWTVFGMLLVTAALLAACGTEQATPTATPVPGASPEPTSEARYAPEGFGQSYAEIVRLAAEETADGPVTWCDNIDPPQAEVVLAAFEARYPDVKLEFGFCEAEVRDRIELELHAGVVTYDVFDTLREVIADPAGSANLAQVLAGPFDYEGLGFPAEYGIANRRKDIAGEERGVWGGAEALISGLIYNVDLVPPDKHPSSFEDCLDPYWSQRMAIDTRPTNLRFLGLDQFWGEERLMEWGQAAGANNPLWSRGETALTARIASGEVAMMCGGLVDRAYSNGLIAEGSPVRAVPASDLEGRVAGAPSPPFGIAKATTKPNAALLVGTWAKSHLAEIPLLDHEDFKWAVAPEVPGSPVGDLVAELGLQIIDVSDDDVRLLELQNALLEAWGFPTPQLTR